MTLHFTHNEKPYVTVPVDDPFMQDGDIYINIEARTAKETLMPRGTAWGLNNVVSSISTRSIALTDELWNAITDHFVGRIRLRLVS